MRSRHVLLLLPGLLGACARNPAFAVEAARSSGAGELRGLRTLLSRASRQGGAQPGASPERLLFETLGITREAGDWPSAALCAVADGAAWHPEAWIRADPVHLEPGRSDLRLGDPRELDVTREESAELCSSINRALNGVPGRLEALAPARWYIGLDATPRLRTREPSLAVGGPVAEALPRGTDAAMWMRALTEIQMLLHDLPVNRARNRRGRPAVNSVWFWGVGPLPRRPDRAPDLCLWSDSALAEGLGRRLGAPYRPLPGGAEALLQEEGSRARDIVFCDSLHYAVRLEDWSAWLELLKEWEAQWFEPLRRALWSGKLARLRIALDDAGCFELSASARWHWWRRPESLATHVAKSGAGATSAIASPRGRAGPGPESICGPRHDGKQGGQSGDH